MLPKSVTKHIRSLHHGKFRAKYHEFIAEGIKLTEDLLYSDYIPCCVCATEDWYNNTTNLNKFDCDTYVVNEAELQSISLLASPNKVLAVFKKKNTKIILPEENELSLALDGVRDPGNLGTIIRIADWYGIDKIYCSDDCVDVYNPKTIQATMGSIARVNVFYVDLEKIIVNLPLKVNVFGTFLNGENVYKINLPDAGLIIIGNEANGISDKLAGYAKTRLKVPSFREFSEFSGGAESLNVSIATALICSEFRRKAAK